MATMTLEGLTERITTAFGDDCSAIVQYGASASSDNVLVILRALRPAALRASATAIAAWQKQGHRAPLILTEAEWRSSRDVFAMEHADIGARHRVECSVVALGSAARENNVHRVRPDEIGNLLAGCFDRLLELRSEAVGA